MTSVVIVHPGPTRVLLALVRVWGRDGRATVRSVAVEADRSIRTTHDRLQELRDLGLVEWQEGRAGTLRPAVRRVA